MTILLGDKTEIKKFNYEQIESDHLLQKASKECLENLKEEQDSVKCLYVGQREFATVTYTDPFIEIIGSDDATTCHILLLVDESNYNCSLCHLDGSETYEGISQMIESLERLRNDPKNKVEYSAYLVGGFEDSKKYSIDLTLAIFTALIEIDQVFNLRLCINTKLNNVVKNGINYPIIYGIGYDIRTKRVFVCNKFLNKGPEMSVRNARHYSSEGNLEIYDPINYRVKIGPFDYNVYDYIPKCVNLSDQLLLKYFSTSPEQEPEHFVQNLKQTFKFMIEHPRPLITYFKNNQTFFYSKKEDGSWKKI